MSSAGVIDQVEEVGNAVRQEGDPHGVREGCVHGEMEAHASVTVQVGSAYTTSCPDELVGSDELFALKQRGRLAQPFDWRNDVGGKESANERLGSKQGPDRT